jgi:dTDP-glucose 4,6-dehydratase
MMILVTGGAGFIGSHFIRLILKERPEWQVINLDKLTYSGNLQNLRDVEERAGHERYFFVQGDVCDAPLIAALFGGSHATFRQLRLPQSNHSAGCPIEAAVHFASESHVDRSILDPSDFYRTNVEGTRILVENARRFWRVDTLRSSGVRFRFLHISTDEVYGSLEPRDLRFTEESPLKPNSPYAASKAAADLTVLAYAHTYGVPALITRCTNNYGPFQHPEKFIPLFVTNAIENRPLPLYGDGLQVRDWIHVEDHCRALLAVLERGQTGEVYNVGAAEEHSNLEVAELIVQMTGRGRDSIRRVPDRAGHDRRYALDATKLESALGWRATYTFAAGLKSTVRWYQEHPSWWKRIKNDEFWKYYREAYGAIG